MKSVNVCTRIQKPTLVINNSNVLDGIAGESEVSYNFIVPFDMEQIVNRQNIQVWQYNFISINEPLSYNLILSQLIRAKFTDEDALAIALNYNNPFESEDKRNEHNVEYENLQQWRAKAKLIAQSAYDYAVKQNFQ